MGFHSLFLRLVFDTWSRNLKCQRIVDPWLIPGSSRKMWPIAKTVPRKEFFKQEVIETGPMPDTTMFFDRTGYLGEYCEIAISSDDSPPCLLRRKWKGRSGEGGGQSPPSMIGTHSFERVLREVAEGATPSVDLPLKLAHHFGEELERHELQHISRSVNENIDRLRVSHLLVFRVFHLLVFCCVLESGVRPC